MNDIYYLYGAYGIMISLYAMWAKQMFGRTKELSERLNTAASMSKSQLDIEADADSECEFRTIQRGKGSS